MMTHARIHSHHILYTFLSMHQSIIKIIKKICKNLKTQQPFKEQSKNDKRLSVSILMRVSVTIMYRITHTHTHKHAYNRLKRIITKYNTLFLYTKYKIPEHIVCAKISYTHSRKRLGYNPEWTVRETRFV